MMESLDAISLGLVARHRHATPDLPAPGTIPIRYDRVARDATASVGIRSDSDRRRWVGSVSVRSGPVSSATAHRRSPRKPASQRAASPIHPPPAPGFRFASPPSPSPALAFLSLKPTRPACTECESSARDTGQPSAPAPSPGRHAARTPAAGSGGLYTSTRATPAAGLAMHHRQQRPERIKVASTQVHTRLQQSLTRWPKLRHLIEASPRAVRIE
jgi:hypothetical protein